MPREALELALIILLRHQILDLKRATFEREGYNLSPIDTRTQKSIRWTASIE